MNVYRNNKADEAAKKGTEMHSSSQGTVTSLGFLKKRIRRTCWNGINTSGVLVHGKGHR
jgi:hypothetical protein